MKNNFFLLYVVSTVNFKINFLNYDIDIEMIGHLP